MRVQRAAPVPHRPRVELLLQKKLGVGQGPTGLLPESADLVFVYRTHRPGRADAGFGAAPGERPSEETSPWAWESNKMRCLRRGT